MHLRPLLWISWNCAALLVFYGCGRSTSDGRKSKQVGAGGSSGRPSASGMASGGNGGIAGGAGASGDSGRAGRSCYETDFVDPACPPEPPPPEAGCSHGAICDYYCESGCKASEYFCAQPGETWRTTLLGCPDECPATTVRGWSGTQTLRFAPLEGDCGVLGDLSYDIDSGRLERLSCSVTAGTVSDCSVIQAIQCTSDQGESVELDLSLERFRSVWGGTAIVRMEGVLDKPCTGTYTIATR